MGVVKGGFENRREFWRQPK